MKHPLDDKINSLLASRPLRAPEDFTARVLDAAEAVPSARQSPRRRWTVALPVAAAIALMLTLTPRPQPTESLIETPYAGSNPALEEAMRLDQGLTGLESLEAADVETLEVDGLLATFDALYLDMQS